MRQRLAWILFGLNLAGFVAEFVLLAHAGELAGSTPVTNGWPIVPLACVAGGLLGALVVARHPRHPVGWLLVVGQFGTQLGLVAQFYALHVLHGHGWGSTAAGHRSEWFSAGVSANWALAFVAAVFLLAPSGTLPSRRWRPALAACLLTVVATIVGVLLIDPTEFGPDSEKEPTGAAGVLLTIAVFSVVVSLVSGATALVRRLRRSTGDERLQLRWIAASATFLAASVVAIVAVAVAFHVSSDNIVLEMLLFLAYASVPVATGVAMLRHRLYDIDVIVSRAVLLTVATAFVAAGYVVLVVLIGGNAGGFWPSLLATALVAMAFQPLRVWVVRLADRLAYGTRAAPYEALSDLARRLGESPDPVQLLPAVARAAGEAVSATGVVARFSVGGVDRTASWPWAGHDEPVEGAVVVEVPVGHEPLGAIVVSLPRGRELRDPERVLLERLAEHAELAFRNAGLSEQLASRVIETERQASELARSRQRLFAARDGERARLEQAIRRDVLAHLSPLPAQLDALADRVPVPAYALGDLIEACNAGLEALREITRGVYPAQLERAGLGPALSAHLTRWGQGTVDLADVAGRRFDARVEAATYFCFAEGVRDFAPPVDVRLTLDDGHLVLTLTGCCASDEALPRMRDRLDVLGGSVAREQSAGRTELAVRVPTAPAVPADPAMVAVTP